VWLLIILASIMLVSLIICVKFLISNSDDFYFGVEIAYGDFEDCKVLVDKVRNYTNLFVVGVPLTYNRTLLGTICNYVYEANLHFIVQFTSPVKYSYDVIGWIFQAKEKYGEKFIGVYYFDEPGGKQLDKEDSRFAVEAGDYSDAAEAYIYYLYKHIECYISTGIKVFTADYGLYWFDYKAGYSVVLAEFGWNHSRHLHIALCRGASRMQNKEWGAIITWKYEKPPYIESGSELYSDLILAYNAGAKYVIVFNYPKISEYGVLTEEHFKAMRDFWKYLTSNSCKDAVSKADLAYVLPRDYGFGFRTPNDTIWGLWPCDELSWSIWVKVNNLLDEYGLRLDIIYDDPRFNKIIKYKYDDVVFWDQTG